jgi:tRNA-modifying protein YgfZ
MTRAELYAGAKKNGALIDLSHRAKWRITGTDRVRFLNGQVSNDVRKLKPNDETIHACVLTAKGKLCGDVFISNTADFLWLDAEPALRESLAARLERYIIADDVALEDVTEPEALLHIFSKTAVRSHELIMLAKPTICCSQRFGAHGRDILIAREAAPDLVRQLTETFVPLDDAMLETFRIEAGVPRWGAELDENILPNEAGLERDAIDYHKGCYVGQEVISRIKSVGHVNRSLHGFVSESPLAAGMALFMPNEGSEKPVGHLTSAAWSFGLEKWAALGYLKRGADSPTLEARSADSDAIAEVAVKDLPLVPF